MKPQQIGLISIHFNVIFMITHSNGKKIPVIRIMSYSSMVLRDEIYSNSKALSSTSSSGWYEVSETEHKRMTVRWLVHVCWWVVECSILKYLWREHGQESNGPTLHALHPEQGVAIVLPTKFHIEHSHEEKVHSHEAVCAWTMRNTWVTRLHTVITSISHRHFLWPDGE